MPVARSGWMDIRAEDSARRPAEAEAGAQAQLRQLIAGYKTTFLVQAAAELNLADLLAEGTQDVGRLAALTGAKPDALRRLLFALAQIGLLSRQPGDRFTLTPLGRCLRTGHPAGLNASCALPGARHHPAAVGQPHPHGAERRDRVRCRVRCETVRVLRRAP